VPLSELSSSSRRSAAEPPGTGSGGRGLAVGPPPTVTRDDSVTVTRAVPLAVAPPSDDSRAGGHRHGNRHRHAGGATAGAGTQPEAAGPRGLAGRRRIRQTEAQPQSSSQVKLTVDPPATRRCPVRRGRVRSRLGVRVLELTEAHWQLDSEAAQPPPGPPARRRASGRRRLPVAARAPGRRRPGLRAPGWPGPPRPPVNASLHGTASGRVRLRVGFNFKLQ
jgi:hypothetical protein